MTLLLNSLIQTAYAQDKVLMTSTNRFGKVTNKCKQHPLTADVYRNQWIILTVWKEELIIIILPLILFAGYSSEGVCCWPFSLI